MFSGSSGAPAVSVVNEHGALAPITDGDAPLQEPPKAATPVESSNEKPESTEGQDGERRRTPSPPMSPGATLVRKFGSLLVGRGDDSRRSGTYGKRASILGGFTPRASAEVNDEEKRQLSAGPVMESEKDGAAERTPVSAPSPMLSHSQSQHLPAAHRRATTLLDAQTRATKHERRSSTGGNLIPGGGGSIGRHRRPSTGFGTSSRPLGDRTFGKTEEEDEAVVDENGASQTNGHEKTQEEQQQDDKDFKPVYLKGLFSVATTSTKPPSTLKADIRQVLYRMQVQYRETRTGFDCIHMPSIDLSSMSNDHSRQRHQKQETDASTPVPTTGEESSTRPVSPSTTKTLPPIPRDYAATPASTNATFTQGLPAGETDEDLFELIGANKLAVRFEINVVKVPWLPLHGIQFRRASGDGWQYHMLARRVLTELKL